jgi:hypothetical protein
VKISEQAIACLASENIGQIGSTYCQMVEEESGEKLAQDQIAGLL